MKHLNNFTKDESGAVTVDWVVLTAAIVGIAMAVIALISGGVQDASTGINEELETASAFSFPFAGTEGTSKISELLASNEMDLFAAHDVILSETPDGYEYLGGVDTATDTAIYFGNTDGTDGTFSVNGEILNEADYDLNANAVPFDPYV